MSEGGYKVVIKGYGNTEQGKLHVEQELAALFNIDQKVAKQLLEASTESPRDVKVNVNSETAERYLKALKETGADGEVIDTRFDFSHLSLE